jgi:hypothetical protein
MILGPSISADLGLSPTSTGTPQSEQSRQPLPGNEFAELQALAAFDAQSEFTFHQPAGDFPDPSDFVASPDQIAEATDLAALARFDAEPLRAATVQPDQIGAPTPTQVPVAPAVSGPAASESLRPLPSANDIIAAIDLNQHNLSVRQQNWASEENSDKKVASEHFDERLEFDASTIREYHTQIAAQQESESIALGLDAENAIRKTDTYSQSPGQRDEHDQQIETFATDDKIVNKAQSG